MNRVFEILFFVFLFSSGLIYGQDKSTLLNGLFSVGYSHIYNYEQIGSSKIGADLLRGDLIITYKKLLFESDYQYFFVNNGKKYFFQNSIGYRINAGNIFPQTYLHISYVEANRFPVDGLIYNKHHKGFGYGGLFNMDLEFLLNGDAAFAVTYFPSDRIFYKRMHVGWEIKTIGISVGGIGVRIPDGRYYSGFIFQLRYKW